MPLPAVGALRASLLALPLLGAVLTAQATQATCAPTAHDDPHGQVWLRLRNSSDKVFVHVWQGHPLHDTDFDFGRIGPGRSSHWQPLPASPMHYRKTAIQFADGRQRIHVTDQDYPGGVEALAPGWYTFDYRLDAGGTLQLTVIDEGCRGLLDHADGHRR